MAEEVVVPEKNDQIQDKNAENTPNSTNDMSIIVNTSAVSEEKTDGDFKYGFTLPDLYKIGLEFYKKEKDTLTLSYGDKIQLVALWKQVSCGRYSDSKLPDIGYFDVIGNDRRKAWEALGDTAPDVAKERFCEILEKNTQTFVPFVEARKRLIEAEIERKRKEEEERLRREEEERRRKEEADRIRKEEEERIRLALEAERLRIKEEEEKKRVEQENANKTEQQTPSETTKLAPTLVNGDSNGRNIAPASLWTRPKLQEFINHVKRDASSVIVVGRGETVTIRVPTHENGSCLFWEFATESYDVGFGVFFEWSKKQQSSTQNDFSIKSNESDNDDTTKTATNNEDKSSVEVNNDPTIISENERNIEIKNSDQDEILPVLRRNSQEEVIVGSHMYPGQGVYLLKFDNSYSLLRSKTLYYRVYYTK
eukprot:TCONS_00054381-protein